MRCMKCGDSGMNLSEALFHYESTGHDKFSSYGPHENTDYYLSVTSMVR